MGRRLFRVASVGLDQRPDTVCVAVDYAFRSAPLVTLGQRVEFRNPTGGVTKAVVSALLFIQPDPDRPSVVSVQPDPLGAPVEVGAEVWALSEEAPA